MKTPFRKKQFIYRCSNDTAYKVRFLENGTFRNKSFADRNFGGRYAALAAAESFRDSIYLVTEARERAVKQRNKAEMLNIIRESESSRFDAWRVKVMLNGKIERKTFADSHYGGYEGSLKAAKEYRDYLRSLLPRK